MNIVHAIESKSAHRHLSFSVAFVEYTRTGISSYFRKGATREMYTEKERERRTHEARLNKKK